MTERLLTRAEVEKRCGVTCSTVYRWMRSGQFPEPLKIGPRAVRWPEGELIAWLEERPRATGDGEKS